MTATSQEIYSLAQSLKNGNPFWRAALLRTNGAHVIKGSRHPSDRNDLDAQRWRITIHGITGEGWSHQEALNNWIRWADWHHKMDLSRRATDHRVDCPYNGQGLPEDAMRQAPAPETLPQAKAEEAPTLELAGGASPGSL
ncbi:hypothetical protein [Leisingera sp. ANG-M7]|uniref:hypothetical protein n=1 Tax=Leisingera sp. ANG-M7 TaxID=1577902 RepID=UPI00057CBEDE|nr:hypothetical protein [Leisingera sp. ANG-M7]KIC36524.1 hypothetical protein RA26_12365 [Leisingera sp. ANG-M7]